MSSRRLFTWASMVVFCLGCVAAPAVWAQSAEMCLEAVLVWGTNDPKPSNRDLKELEPELAKKLGKAPYKWKNYFEVNRKTTWVALKVPKKISVSNHCTLEIQNLGQERVEVKLVGEGKPVSRHVESLPMGQIMVLGGDAKNDTAWLIVLRQIPASN